MYCSWSSDKLDGSIISSRCFCDMVSFEVDLNGIASRPCGRAPPESTEPDTHHLRNTLELCVLFSSNAARSSPTVCAAAIGAAVRQDSAGTECDGALLFLVSPRQTWPCGFVTRSLLVPRLATLAACRHSPMHRIEQWRSDACLVLLKSLARRVNSIAEISFTFVIRHSL